MRWRIVFTRFSSSSVLLLPHSLQFDRERRLCISILRAQIEQEEPWWRIGCSIIRGRRLGHTKGSMGSDGHGRKKNPRTATASQKIPRTATADSIVPKKSTDGDGSKKIRGLPRIRRPWPSLFVRHYQLPK